MRVLLMDVLPQRVLGLFDHLGLTYSTQLNGPGSCTFVVSAADWRALLDQSFGVGRTYVYVIDETVETPAVEWWGMIWDFAAVPEQRTVQLAAAGIQTVLERRTLRYDLAYAAQDQSVIARDLVVRAQQGTDRQLWIDTPAHPTGVLRDRTYVGLERKRYGELLGQLAAVINGFDYRFEAQWAGGATPPTQQLAISFPAPRLDPLVTIVARGNVTITQVAGTATNMVAAVDGIGAQDLRVTRTGSTPGYPPLDGAVSHTSVIEAATLEQHADRQLAANSQPRVTVSMVVTVEPGQGMPVASGMAVRLLDVDHAFDRVMVCTDVTVSQVGVGRQASVSLVEPPALARSDEAAGP
jgi:hypothetical protein